jgi:hypothetical protein
MNTTAGRPISYNKMTIFSNSFYILTQKVVTRVNSEAFAAVMIQVEVFLRRAMFW